MRTVALFFGSFNPIHIGHLALGNYIAEYCGVDEVCFVISPLNPLKNQSDLLADDLRLQMIHLAIDGYSKFSVSAVEFSLPKPSFTYITLQQLSHSFPDTHFILIMGGDYLDLFPKWRNFEWIMDNYEVWVYPRLGSSNSIPPIFHNMKCLNTPILEISSSFIRQSLALGKEVRFFLPPKVFDFIQQKHLYQK